jgi:hypothetical protein
VPPALPALPAPPALPALPARLIFGNALIF